MRKLPNIKVHDLHIEYKANTGVQCWNVNKGVIYNNKFYWVINNQIPSGSDQTHGLGGYGVSVESDGTFEYPWHPLGTENAIFIEDNYFYGVKHAVSGSDNANYVFRHNKAEMGWRIHGLVDAHGSDAGRTNTFEIYDNELYLASNNLEPGPNYGVLIRGGSGVIYNNKIYSGGGSTTSHAILLSDMDLTQPYPQKGQPRNIYVWGNTYDGSPVGATESDGTGSYNYFQEDRYTQASFDTQGYYDYREQLKPDYQPYPYPHPLRGVAAENVIYANSCSRNDIQSAVNSASVGDVVELPSCTYNGFSGTVTIPAGIELRGQGASQTILRRSSSDSNPLIEFDCSNGEEAKFSKIKLQGTYTQGTTEKGLYLDNCKNFRVWNSEFEDFTHACIYAMGYSYGVIWDSTIKDCYTPGYGYGVKVDGTAPGEWSPDMGDASWSRPLGLGGPDAVYVEDCILSNNRHNVDANMGGRFVVRHNTITGNAADGQMIATHGETSAGNRGTRKFEIYNNVFNHVSQPYSVYPYGGEGVVFNNVINNIGNPVNWFLISHPCCDAPADCTAWPEVDQVTNVYIWGNTVNGASRNYPRISSHCLSYNLFLENRDWYTGQMPGYVPYSYPHPLRGT